VPPEQHQRCRDRPALPDSKESPGLPEHPEESAIKGRVGRLGQPASRAPTVPRELAVLTVSTAPMGSRASAAKRAHRGSLVRLASKGLQERRGQQDPPAPLAPRVRLAHQGRPEAPARRELQALPVTRDPRVTRVRPVTLGPLVALDLLAPREERVPRELAGLRAQPVRVERQGQTERKGARVRWARLDQRVAQAQPD
jgi:hypothetical protein